MPIASEAGGSEETSDPRLGWPFDAAMSDASFEKWGSPLCNF